MKRNKCQDCYFWDPVVATAEKTGYCRINPPTAGLEGFPLTFYTDFCGSFCGKESQFTMQKLFDALDKVRNSNN